MPKISQIGEGFWPRPSKGFTLLELIVVITLLAIMFWVASYEFGDNAAKKMEQEANQLERVMTFAQEEAMFRGHEYGLVVQKWAETIRYHVVFWDPLAKKWQTKSSPAFKSHELPDFLTLQIVMDDQIIPLTVDQTLAEKPIIFFLSSGEITPFSLEIINTKTQKIQYMLKTDGVNGILLTKEIK